MESKLPELEQRLSNLQAQVARVWPKAERYVPVPPAEQRLLGVADQYAEYLQQWATTVERHARAVSQLEAHLSEWEGASSRVQEDASHRLQDLEAIIKREWDALRKFHEEPVQELREQAATLTEACLAMVSATEKSFDRTEARLASFESDLHSRMTDLMRELQSAVAEIRARDQQPRIDGGGEWSLDDVTRLHSQIRDSQIPAVTGTQIERFRGTPRVLPMADLDGSASSVVSEAQPATAEPSIAQTWRIAVAGLVLVVIIAAVFGWRLQNQVRAAAERVQATEVRSQQAVEDAARQAATAREEAAREISSAREMATRAQRIGNVLAAPDLIRYNLAGSSGAPGASGQALWSRSRGFVLSGSRIPPPSQGGVHQVWLLTRSSPVKAGTLVPDADGTVTLVQEAPGVPRAVVGVMVTAEDAGGSDTPSGEPLLTSVFPGPSPTSQ